MCFSLRSPKIAHKFQVAYFFLQQTAYCFCLNRFECLAKLEPSASYSHTMLKFIENLLHSPSKMPRKAIKKDKVREIERGGWGGVGVVARERERERVGNGKNIIYHSVSFKIASLGPVQFSVISNFERYNGVFHILEQWIIVYCCFWCWY